MAGPRGAARPAVPENDGLALVAQAKGGDFFRLQALAHRRNARKNILINGLRVLFGASGGGAALRVRAGEGAHDLPLRVREKDLAGRGALIHGKNIARRHIFRPSRTAAAIPAGVRP